MRLKCLFFVLAYFGAIAVLLAQNGTPHPDTESLCDILRTGYREHQASSEGPPIDVLFFDINGDGIPEALMSFRVSLRVGGCHGNDWLYHHFKDGKWQTGPLKEENELWYDPNVIFARGDDFFSLAMDGQKPKLVHIYTSYGWTSKGKGHTDHASEVSIDSDGYLTTIPIPELSGEYHDGDDGDFPDQEPPSPESLAMEKRLTHLSIETYLPQKKPWEGEYAAFVAKEEAEGQPAVAREKTPDAVTPTDAQHETQDAVPIPSSSHRWLYLVLSFGILCATVYFMRKK